MTFCSHSVSLSLQKISIILTFIQNWKNIPIISPYSQLMRYKTLKTLKTFFSIKIKKWFKLFDQLYDILSILSTHMCDSYQELPLEFLDHFKLYVQRYLALLSTLSFCWLNANSRMPPCMWFTINLFIWSKVSIQILQLYPKRWYSQCLATILW